jgi:PAS domain S-box-containing protein
VSDLLTPSSQFVVSVDSVLMNANDLLVSFMQLLFILLGFLTAADYFRHKSRTRLDIALMFGSLAVAFAIQNLGRLLGVPPRIIDVTGSIALIAQPYFLLRIVRYFRPVPAKMMRAAFIGMIGLWAALIPFYALPRAPQVIIFLTLVLYFGLVDGYAMIAFVRGALTTRGVVRQRLRFAAAGSGLLGSSLLMLGVAVLIPALEDAIVLLVLIASAFAGVSYYIGFAPPRWLRRAWQLNELRQFIMHISRKPMDARWSISSTLDELCAGVLHAVGGMKATIAQSGAAKDQWTLRYPNGQAELITTYQDDEGLIARVWHDRVPIFVRASDGASQSRDNLLKTIGADTMLLAPIATVEHAWGVLIVFLRSSSLFVDDDLDLTMLFAQQSAIFLENNSLIEELQDYSEQLEQRVAERTQELEESKELYRRIVETAQEGIWTVNHENKTTFVNARLAEMLGYTIEEVLDLPTSAFVNTDDYVKARAKGEQRRQGVKDQYEIRLKRKDATEIWTLVSGTPLTDERGQYIGSLAMVADITERKRAEDEILKLNTELERRVVERTAQLRAVNQELEAFSYSVSHDLRAPLRVLDGFSLALIEDYADRLDAQANDYLNRIRNGSQRMGQLIDSLLKLSQLSRAELRVESVNLSEMVRTIGAELAEQHPERNVELIVQEGLTVSADKNLLHAALVNLLNNAWKFTGKQSDARIEFGLTENQGKQAYFIRDNGVGFDMTHSKKLFGAFQRLHGMNEFEGTGIGLATVGRIFHRHGGEIWAEGVVNQGATFYFTFSMNT